MEREDEQEKFVTLMNGLINVMKAANPAAAKHLKPQRFKKILGPEPGTDHAANVERLFGMRIPTKDGDEGRA